MGTIGTYAGVGDGDGAGGAVGGAVGGSGSSKNPVSYSGTSCTTENKKDKDFKIFLIHWIVKIQEKLWSNCNHEMNKSSLYTGTENLSSTNQHKKKSIIFNHSI